jgi:hypothetical protein
MGRITRKSTRTRIRTVSTGLGVEGAGGLGRELDDGEHGERTPDHAKGSKGGHLVSGAMGRDRGENVTAFPVEDGVIMFHGAVRIPLDRNETP